MRLVLFAGGAAAGYCLPEYAAHGARWALVVALFAMWLGLLAMCDLILKAIKERP